MRAMLLLFLLPGAATAQTPRMQPPVPLAAPQAESTGAAKSNVLYGTAGKEKLKLDVYLPPGKPAAAVPAVLLIHGGAWFEGDKDNLARMGRWLARNGYAAFSINYRLHDGKKNIWPAQLEDAEMAVRWVRAHAAEYNVDPGRIGAFGHSAGAQIAAMLGVSQATPEGSGTAQLSSSVQAVVAQAGPSDFTSATYKDAESQAFFTELFGASEQQDPARWRAASPALLVTDKTPPFLLVHGTKDNEVPIVQSEELRDALKAHGVPVTFVTVDDGHMLQTAEAARTLAIETVKFFDATLKKQPEVKTADPAK